MKDYISVWARLLHRFRWLIITLTPVVVFFATAPAKNIYFAHSPDMWFVEGDQANLDYQTLKENFGESQNLLVGFSQADGSSVIEADLLEAVREVHDFLAARDEVIQVQSLVNYQIIQSQDDTLTIVDLLDREAPPFALIPADQSPAEIESLLSTQPIVLGDMVTNDMRHTAMVAELQMAEGGRVDHHIALVNALKDFIDVNGYAAKGIDLHVFGRPYISHQLTAGTVQDQMLFYPLLALISAVVCLFVFRDFRAVMGPFMLIVNSVMVVYGVQGALGWPTTVANALMPFLVIIIGIGISVHVMMAYFRNLGTGMEPPAALEATLRHLLQPMLYTSLTTGFGFLGIAITNLQPLREYGILAIIGVAASLFFSLTLLPAMLSTIRKAPRWAQGSTAPQTGAVARLIIWSGVHSRLIVAVCGVMAVLAVAATLSLKLDTNFVNIFKKDSEFQQSFAYFDTEFKGGQSIEIILDSGREDGIYEPAFLAQADALVASLPGYEGMGKARSALDYIKQMNVALNNGDETFRRLPDSAKATAQLLLLYENSGPERSLTDLMSTDRRHLRISVGAQNMSATQTNALIETLSGDIARNWPDLKVTLTGDLALFNQLEILVAKGMVSSFAMSFATIVLSMLVLFRSFRNTLFATLSSVLPIFLGGALMRVMGIYPDINTLIVASVTIGLAVDDSIHFILDYEGARKRGADVDEAIAEAGRSSGSAMLLSTVILAGGFSVFLLASLQSGVNFGLISVVVMVSALLADLILLPALLKQFDRRRELVTPPDAVPAE